MALDPKNKQKKLAKNQCDQSTDEQQPLYEADGYHYLLPISSLDAVSEDDGEDWEDDDDDLDDDEDEDDHDDDE